MKTKILAGLLLAGSTMFAAPRFGFGVSIGAPAPVIAAAPPCPGPGYEFINGYWQFVGGYRDRDWHADYRRAPEHFDRVDRDRHDEHFRR